MKERMQKTLSQVNGCPQRDRSETEWYGGVQTFMWMCEDNIVEVPFDKEHLFEQILSPSNLSRAYKAVMSNKGCGGIDKMSCEQLLPWLLTNKDLLEKVFLIEWYFHDVVFTHPREGLHSPIPFGFRPISLGAAINLG